MKLYRKFRIAADGKPMIGIRFAMLGVRPLDPAYPKRRYDVKAIAATDLVRPGGGGLSVFTDPASILISSSDLYLFEIDSNDLPTELLNRDAGEPHRLVEPSKEMMLCEFQNLLASTRDVWQRV